MLLVRGLNAERALRGGVWADHRPAVRCQRCHSAESRRVSHAFPAAWNPICARAGLGVALAAPVVFAEEIRTEAAGIRLTMEARPRAL